MKKSKQNNMSLLAQAKNLLPQDLLEFSCIENFTENMLYKLGNIEDVKKILANLPC